DITSGGHRRYLIEEQEGERWEIEFPEGTSPIPASTLQAARFRIKDNRGKPRTQPAHDEKLIPERLMRCAHCGCSVTEQWRSDYRPRSSEPPVLWYLLCQEVNTIRVRRRCSTEEARQHLSPDHCHYRFGRISDAVWDTLRQALLRAPLEPGDEED